MFRARSRATRDWWARLWADRLTFGGFLRRQRRLAQLSLVVMVATSALALLGSGPVLWVTAIQTFPVHPLPLALFFVAVALAGWCLTLDGVGPAVQIWRRSAWATSVVVGSFLFTSWQLDGLGNIAWRENGPFFFGGVALALAVMTFTIGIAIEHPAAGWTGFGVLALGVALLCAALVSLGQVSATSVAGIVGFAAHQLALTVAFLTFLGVTVLAPLELLARLEESHRRLSWLEGLTRRRARFAVLAVGVGGVLLSWSIWLKQDSVTTVAGYVAQTVGSVVLALGALAIIAASDRHPIVAGDLSIAGFWAALVLTAPYLTLLAGFVGVSPDVAERVGEATGEWRWAALWIGGLFLVARRGRVTSGGLFLVLSGLMATLRQFVAIPYSLLTVVAVIFVVIGIYGAVLLLRPDAAAEGSLERRRAALVRATVLCAVLVSLIELVPDVTVHGVNVSIVIYSMAVVVGVFGVLLIRQPGRQLPIPARGATYLRATALGLLLLGAYGVLFSTPVGATIAAESQEAAVERLGLPLVVVFACYRIDGPRRDGGHSRPGPPSAEPGA